MDPTTSTFNLNPNWQSQWGGFSNLMGGTSGAGMTDPSNLGGSITGIGTTPGLGAGALGKGVFGSGMNGMQFAQAALGGLQSLGNIWMGLKSLNLAKKQFNFSKDFANTNLANQTKVYNTNLADRENSRAVMEGLTPAQAQSYVASNSLANKTLGG